MKGFLFYRLGKYKDSIDALERAVALNPDDGYAYAVMARDYAMLARTSNGLNKKRYKDKALLMQRKAREVAAPNGQRLAWLGGWLKRRL